MKRDIYEKTYEKRHIYMSQDTHGHCSQLRHYRHTVLN